MALTDRSLEAEPNLAGITDPTLLSGQELFDHIATHGYRKTIRVSDIDAESICDVEARLGKFLPQITVQVEFVDPENPAPYIPEANEPYFLVVHFRVRDDI